MKTPITFLFFTCSTITIWGGCKRTDDTEIGGKGGNATLVASVKHHTQTIDSAVVYIKYNATDKALSYDDSTAVSGGTGNKSASFTGLKKGKYFLFAKGYDLSIAEKVEGGIPYTISEERSQDLSLPVTEAGH